MNDINIFTQIVVVVGKIRQNSVQMLGTGFFISAEGDIVTTKHVVGVDDSNIVVLFPHIQNINSYQDTTDTRCRPIPAKIKEIDPIRDICILKTPLSFGGQLPELGSFDDINIGESLSIFGFPHCVMGRRVLTLQRTELGAKILLDSNGIKSKFAVINTQARPGQSGSLVLSPKHEKIVGILIGAYAPSVAGISLGGINPQELHQTTHCVSAEYIKNML